MSDFRQLSESVWASPQIHADEVAEAAKAGFALVINNRPDAEVPDQPDGALIEQAALAAGLEYVAIPIGHAGFGEAQISAMQDALARAQGKVLAYCRSGTRSTFLWSLAQAQSGEDPGALTSAAANAGYDISPIRGALDMLAAKARG